MTIGCEMPAGTAISKSRTFAIALFVAMGFFAFVGTGNAQSTQMGTTSKTLNQRNAVGLNPQPEPPSKSKIKQKLKPAEMRGLNPQPEPPKPPNRN